MKAQLIISVTLVVMLTCLALHPSFAQTNVLTNGSFESDLTGWTTGQHLEVGAAGTCGYNATTAAGTETTTGLAAFPPTDGTKLAMGGVSSTNAGAPINSCTLYQDVAIPAGATTATFTFDIGVKGNINGINNGYKVAIYSTASVPGFNSVSPLVGPAVYATVAVADATLQSKTSGSFNISARAGQTVRFAIINAVQNNRGEVIGVDNVKLLVTVPEHTVTANANGTGTGNVSSSPAGINYNYDSTNTGSAQFVNGSNVVLTAAANGGSTASWAGTCTAAGGVEGGNGSSTATCTLNNLTSAKTAAVTFSQIVTVIPALTDWGMVIMSLLFVGSTIYLLRKRTAH